MGGFGELGMKCASGRWGTFAPPLHSPIFFPPLPPSPMFSLFRPHSLTHKLCGCRRQSDSRALAFLLTVTRPLLAPTVSACSYSAIGVSPSIYLLSSQLCWCLQVLEKALRITDLISSFLKKVNWSWASTSSSNSQTHIKNMKGNNA